MIRLKNFAFSLAVVLLCGFFMVVIAEAFFRIYDGYSFLKIPLMHKHNKPIYIGNTSELSEHILWSNAELYLDKLTLNEGTKKDWFFEEPPPLVNRAKHVDPDLLKRRNETADFKAAMGPGYVWNYFFLKKEVCEKNKSSDYFAGAEKEIYAYKPMNQGEHPRYRFLPNKTYPDGLVTNEFGYRGKPLSYKKESGTIRIAFLGASTTIAQHGFPFSYPELVEYWLNRWANEKHLSVNFETINAARSGIASQDLSETVSQEIMHLSPDFILYYEGANQFWPHSFINYKLKKLFHKPSSTFQFYPIEKYSAFSRRLFEFKRLVQFNNGKEPFKPPLKTNWPATLDEFNPDITSKELPLQLPVILSDWDKIRQASQSIGAEFIPLSFVWLVKPGMQLNLQKNMNVFLYLNQSMWPFSYAWIRRMADFQNRVFAKYAKENNLYFIDYAKYYPQDPVFFDDAIHMTYEGARLQAWIVFQQLIPIIQEKLARGELPKDSQQPGNIPESLAQARSPFLITLDEVKQKC